MILAPSQLRMTRFSTDNTKMQTVLKLTSFDFVLSGQENR